MPVWQQACAEPSKLPDRAMFLAQQMSGAAAVMAPGAHHPGMVISEPIPGAKPLALPPELAGLRAGGAIGQQVGRPTSVLRMLSNQSLTDSGVQAASQDPFSQVYSSSRCK